MVSSSAAFLWLIFPILVPIKVWGLSWVASCGENTCGQNFWGHGDAADWLVNILTEDFLFTNRKHTSKIQ